VALAYYAGTRLLTTTFDALFAQVPRTFVKAADQFYASQTTFQNDEHLTCSLEANSTYEVKVNLVISGTDGNFKSAWSAPSGATGYKICHGPALTSTDRDDTTMKSAAHNLGTSAIYGVNHATNYAGCFEEGLVVTVAAGTLTIQHAQNSSTVNPSGLATNSWMTVRKVA
jgi:hypothetical protein